MKTTKFLAIIALMGLVSCFEQRQKPVREPNLAKYYPYNSEDTIDNPYFFDLLKVDTGRVYYKNLYKENNTMTMVDTILISNYDSVYAETLKTWYHILDLASKKKWEECLHIYEDNHLLMYVPLANTEVLFDADYYIFAIMQSDYYPEPEADQKSLQLFEDDLILTNAAMSANEDYFPEHIERLSWIMSCLYAKLGNKEMALLMADNYKEAVNLSYGAQAAMHNYTKLCIDLYSLLGDNEKVIENMIEYKNFMIQYAKDNDLEIDDYINRLDATIEKVRSDMDE